MWFSRDHEEIARRRFGLGAIDALKSNVAIRRIEVNKCGRSLPRTTLASVVIPTTKRKGILTIRSIRKAAGLHRAGLEVIVVTGARPAGRARNIGASASRGKVLLFADDDIVFDPSDFEKAVGKVLKRTKTVVGGVSIEPFTGYSVIGTRFLALSRMDFEKIGGFDEALYGWEDHEFCMRARIKGYEIVHCPVKIEHYHKRKFSELVWRNLFYERSGTLVAIKYARYLRLRIMRWFFLPFIGRDLVRSDIWRNGITRAFVRMASFYYWMIKYIVGR